MTGAILRRKPCLALIGDMVKSRDIQRRDRAKVQVRFKDFIDDLNKRYRRHLLSKFVITLGDEFQGLLLSADSIPELMRDIERNFEDRELRAGIGFGTLDTPIQREAINIDGPALHNARAAIQQAKLRRELGGVFAGFGDLDPVLNGFARILWFTRSKFTQQQIRVIDVLRSGASQKEISEQFGITRQAISKTLVSSGWYAYDEAEKGWGMVLRKYVEPMLGIAYDKSDRDA
jgi:SatD family (SatD)